MVFEAVNPEVCPYIWKQTNEKIKVYVPIPSTTTHNGGADDESDDGNSNNNNNNNNNSSALLESSLQVKITPHSIYAKLIDSPEPFLNLRLMTEVLPAADTTTATSSSSPDHVNSVDSVDDDGDDGDDDSDHRSIYSSYAIKSHHIVFNLKKKKLNENLPYLLHEPISLVPATSDNIQGEEEELVSGGGFILEESHAAPIEELERELLISSSVLQDLIHARIRFDQLRREYLSQRSMTVVESDVAVLLEGVEDQLIRVDEGEPSIMIAEQWNHFYASLLLERRRQIGDEKENENGENDDDDDDDEKTSRVMTNEQFTEQLYKFILSSNVTDLRDRLKLFSRVAKLGHVKAKLQCIRIYDELIQLEKSSPSSPRLSSTNDEDGGVVSEEEKLSHAESVVKQLENSCLQYVKSVVFLTERSSSVTSAFIKLATHYQNEGQLQDAFALYVISAMVTGSSIMMEIVGGLYVDDLLGANRTKKLAWYQLGLNRGSANSAQLIAFEHLITKNYQLSYNYFKVANFIDPTKTIAPEVLLGLQKMRDLKAAQEEQEEDEDEENSSPSSTPDNGAVDQQQQVHHEMAIDEDELFEKALDMVELIRNESEESEESATAVLTQVQTSSSPPPREDAQLESRQQQQQQQKQQQQQQGLLEHEPEVEDIEELQVEPTRARPAATTKNPFIFEDKFEGEEDEEEEEQQVPLREDKPGIGWKISEYALTAASVLGIGYFIYHRANQS